MSIIKHQEAVQIMPRHIILCAMNTSIAKMDERATENE